MCPSSSTRCSLSSHPSVAPSRAAAAPKPWERSAGMERAYSGRSVHASSGCRDAIAGLLFTRTIPTAVHTSAQDIEFEGELYDFVSSPLVLKLFDG